MSTENENRTFTNLSVSAREQKEKKMKSWEHGVYRTLN